MNRAALDVTGIGNPIVDIVSPADDATIARLEMSKATMALINQERREQLRELMGPCVQLSGGFGGQYNCRSCVYLEPKSVISERSG